MMDRPPEPYTNYTWPELARYCRQLRVLRANMVYGYSRQNASEYVRALAALDRKRDAILKLLEAHDNLFV